ncbi:MAG TPA: TAXI family TRAP transporter solute-binding subunit [Silvibacterium sp.]|jgi:TRAP transporter TAXI family solute receptor|nr:TAXI family TRAP transporter solute-binding subunit [Silvibacterium sp.]
MSKLDLNRVVRLIVVIVSLVFLSWLGIALWQGSRTQYLTLAAGASDGDSYILGSALKTVVERHYPRIRITLRETGGTVENLQMLEDGRAQLAAAQADVLPGPNARLLAVLYDDTFQLLVPADSPLQKITDLRGKRIALIQTGGQFQSFLRVAEHFGLHQSDFYFVGTTDASADEAFLNGNADAIFRVRAIGNPDIQKLVQSGRARFLPIGQAAAMKISHPAFEPAVIPEGAYLGNPSAPPQDLPTVAVHRTLLARDTANAAAIRAITEVLIDHRQEIMREIPARMTEVRLLLVQTRRPEPQTGMEPPLHPGALSFYEKDKPSFLLAHADVVGLIFTMGLMIGSWIWQLKHWMQKKQKNAADYYSNRVVALISAAQKADSATELENIWNELLNILAEAVRDLDKDKLSEESFHSFRAILQIGMEVTRDRRVVFNVPQ